MMKPTNQNAPGRAIRRAAVAASCLFALNFNAARASIAYGSINNFDTVNDTSNVCHGFEIELDDIHSTDITYTYDYNHYGTPKITSSRPVIRSACIPMCWCVIERSGRTPAGRLTRPSRRTIPPTQGHPFTNPSLNFGGEHFGVGYRANRQPRFIISGCWITAATADPRRRRSTLPRRSLPTRPAASAPVVRRHPGARAAGAAAAAFRSTIVMNLAMPPGSK